MSQQPYSSIPLELERMLELQERKKAIAQAVFDEENSLPFKLTADDLESLFKPLKG